MESNKAIDELLAQIDNKNQEGIEEADQNGVSAEYQENDEFMNVVTREPINGNVNLDFLDTRDATPASSDVIQSSSVAIPQQEANLVDNQVGVVTSITFDSSTASGVHYNLTAAPVTASYMSNGNQVVFLTNPPPVAAAGQAVSAPVAAGSSFTGQPIAPASLEGQQVLIPGVINQQPQNVIVVAQAPMVLQPHAANAFVVAPATNPQNTIIGNSSPAAIVAGQTIARSQTSDWTPTGPSAAVVTPAPSKPAGAKGKKRKLYEQAEFQDPDEEKRRKNAQKAKDHREKTKLLIRNLTESLEQSRQEAADSQTQVQRLKTEVEALRQENERLKNKLIFQDFDLNLF